MSDDSKRPIIVKRVKKHGGGHHGGAWKIAYADFVTAMMAFFLLMWLLDSTSAGDRKGIAEYFQTPLKVALAGGTGSGDSSSIIKGGGQDLTRTEGQMKKGDIQEEKKTINLKAAEAEIARKETLKLQELKGRIEQAIEGNAALKPFRNQILLDITTEGLRIQIADEYSRPMFASGSAQMQPYSRPCQGNAMQRGLARCQQIDAGLVVTPATTKLKRFLMNLAQTPALQALHGPAAGLPHGG